MLNNKINPKLKPEKRNIVAGKTLPRLSLNLHTMPQTSDRQMKKWMLWGVLFVLVFVVIAYFLFN